MLDSSLLPSNGLVTHFVCKLKQRPKPIRLRAKFRGLRGINLLGVAGVEDHRTERLSHSSNRVGPMRGLTPSGVRPRASRAAPK